MVLISGVLKGPYGDPRPGVTITMRSVKTSATVLGLLSSKSTTDESGRYSLTVEPGAFEVIISVRGQADFSVGSIQVYADSQPGTLNDFLRRPGESDITPEIVQTVDRMRAEAAASAAAAKVSEQNAADNVKPVVAAGFGSGPLHTADAFSKDNKSSIQRFTNATLNRPANGTGGLLTMPIDGGPSCSYFAVSVARQAWVGTSNSVNPSVVTWSRLFSTSDRPTVADISNLKDWGLTGYVTSAGSIDFDTLKESRRGLVVSGPNGPTTGTTWLDVYGWELNGGGSDTNRRALQVGYSYGASGSDNGKVSMRMWTGVAWKNWVPFWTGANTTVDSNGFIKKASPIVKLFRDGACELNGESQGVTTERLSDGVYRVSGTLGFNADAQWGGSDGGIEVPLDRNKQPLIWVDYEVEPTGDLLIKTYHRTHPTAPAFARNEVMGYDEGMPIDIPEGRWVDLRVEMPAAEEPDPEIEVEKREAGS